MQTLDDVKRSPAGLGDILISCSVSQDHHVGEPGSFSFFRYVHVPYHSDRLAMHGNCASHPRRQSAGHLFVRYCWHRD